MIDTADHWGPWRPAISHAEQVARFRALRAIAEIYVRQSHPLVAALASAESGDLTDVEAALIELNRLPALQRRRVEHSYIQHQGYKPKTKQQEAP